MPFGLTLLSLVGLHLRLENAVAPPLELLRAGVEKYSASLPQKQRCIQSRERRTAFAAVAHSLVHLVSMTRLFIEPQWGISFVWVDELENDLLFCGLGFLVLSTSRLITDTRSSFQIRSLPASRTAPRRLSRSWRCGL